MSLFFTPRLPLGRRASSDIRETDLTEQMPVDCRARSRRRMRASRESGEGRSGLQTLIWSRLELHKNFLNNFQLPQAFLKLPQVF
jgi:hypothetical protein